MHGHNSKNRMDLSSTSLCRRDFVVASVAATFSFGGVGTAAATSDPDDNFERIKWLIDQREEALTNHLDAVRRFELIEAQHGRPAFTPTVDLLSLLGRSHLDRYYPTFINVSFASFEAVHSFFDDQIQKAADRDATVRGNDRWVMIKAVDFKKTLHALQRKTIARQQWEAETGYNGAEAEVDNCLDILSGIERNILDTPCRSLRDISLKIETVDVWHTDVEELWSVLASMREFVGGGDGAQA